MLQRAQRGGHPRPAHPRAHRRPRGRRLDVLRHDEEGRVDEIRVVARPLSSVAAFAAVVGPRLARRHGRRRALAVRAVTAPLPSVLAFWDRLVSRVSRPATAGRYSDAGVVR